jgi:hypothetical protein
VLNVVNEMCELTNSELLPLVNNKSHITSSCSALRGEEKLRGVGRGETPLVDCLTAYCLTLSFLFHKMALATVAV